MSHNDIRQKTNDSAPAFVSAADDTTTNADECVNTSVSDLFCMFSGDAKGKFLRVKRRAVATW